MLKKSRLNEALAPLANEPFIPDLFQDLSPEEKGELRAFFNGALWRKVLANARTARPSLFPAGLDTPMGPQLALNRLNQLQGWKLLEAALSQPILPPVTPRKTLVETYPDAGRPDFQKSQTTEMKPVAP